MKMMKEVDRAATAVIKRRSMVSLSVSRPKDLESTCTFTECIYYPMQLSLTLV